MFDIFVSETINFATLQELEQRTSILNVVLHNENVSCAFENLVTLTVSCLVLEVMYNRWPLITMLLVMS